MLIFLKLSNFGTAFKNKTFYGKSENTVYTQIWITLITYCLQVLIQLKFNHEGSWFYTTLMIYYIII